MDDNRTWALAELKSNEIKRIVGALISLAFYDSDWKIVEKLCIEYSHHDNDNVRGIAILCFGHLARIHGQLNVDKVIPIIERAFNDNSEFVRGHAESAKDDISNYLNINF